MVYRKFQPVFVLIIVVLFFVQGCAGRAVNPVNVAQSGDVKKACTLLRKEAKQIRQNIKKMIPAVKKADKKRTLLMVSGGLLIVPWFFLDLTDADKIETNAQRARHNYLIDVAKKRNCRFKAYKLKKFYFHDKGYKKRNR
jgi:hypothetical protein